MKGSKMKWIVILVSVLMLSLVFACSDDEETPTDLPTCTKDAWEPNDSETELYDLGSISDCDADSISINPTICPDDDEDWFRVEITETDVHGCVLDPVVIIRLPDGITCSIAATYQCNGSVDMFTTSATVTSTGELIFDMINCAGAINNSGYLHVRVKRVSGSSEKTAAIGARIVSVGNLSLSNIFCSSRNATSSLVPSTIFSHSSIIFTRSRLKNPLWLGSLSCRRVATDSTYVEVSM